jgi:hypothetical protein
MVMKNAQISFILFLNITNLIIKIGSRLLMKKKTAQTVSYPGDMTLWMFEDHPRFDYHLLQFLKRYEVECAENESYLCPKESPKEKDKSKELAFI